MTFFVGDDTRLCVDDHPLYVRKKALAKGATGHSEGLENGLGDHAGQSADCRGSGSLEGAVEAADQVDVTEWFAHETDCPGLHGARPYAFIGVGRDENNRHAVTAGDQPVLQLDSAESRHMQVS